MVEGVFQVLKKQTFTCLSMVLYRWSYHIIAFYSVRIANLHAIKSSDSMKWWVRVYTPYSSQLNGIQPQQIEKKSETL